MGGFFGPGSLYGAQAQPRSMIQSPGPAWARLLIANFSQGTRAHDQAQPGHAGENLLMMINIIGAWPFIAGDQTENTVCTCTEMLLYPCWQFSG